MKDPITQSGAFYLDSPFWDLAARVQKNRLAKGELEAYQAYLKRYDPEGIIQVLLDMPLPSLYKFNESNWRQFACTSLYDGAVKYMAQRTYDKRLMRVLDFELVDVNRLANPKSAPYIFPDKMVTLVEKIKQAVLAEQECGALRNSLLLELFARPRVDYLQMPTLIRRGVHIMYGSSSGMDIGGNFLWFVQWLQELEPIGNHRLYSDTLLCLPKRDPQTLSISLMDNHTRTGHEVVQHRINYIAALFSHFEALPGHWWDDLNRMLDWEQVYSIFTGGSVGMRKAYKRKILIMDHEIELVRKQDILLRVGQFEGFNWYPGRTTI